MRQRQPVIADTRIVEASIHVLVVDDSTVVRGMLRIWLEEEAQVRSVAVARNGVEALDAVAAMIPDVIVLDIEMPELDGYSALPMLRQRCPDAVIIISSNSTPRDGKIALRCLERGATEILPKPVFDSGLGSVPAYRRALIAFVLGLARSAHPIAIPRRMPTAHVVDHGPTKRGQPRTPEAADPLAPRPGAASAIVIGSSTGGPQALHALLADLTGAIARVPVIIAQHMPPVFTSLLAEHLRQRVGVPVREARDGEPLLAGCVYLAPGGKHLRVGGSRSLPRAMIDDGDPVRFARPSIDLLFESAAALFGPAALGLVLTGMGSDGTQGAKAIVKAGGHVLVQDEATSVVWGMPASVLKALPDTRVVALGEAATALSRFVKGARV